MMTLGPQEERTTLHEDRSTLKGNVLSRSSASGEEAPRPRISAFIWGGKVRPSPTLPFGRWKGAAT